MRENTWLLTFGVWITSINIVFSISMHLHTNLTFLYKWLVCHCVYMPHCHYPFAYRRTVRFFHFLAVGSRAAGNTAEQVSVESSGHTTRNGTGGQDGRFTLAFQGLSTLISRNCSLAMHWFTFIPMASKPWFLLLSHWTKNPCPVLWQRRHHVSEVIGTW